MPGCLGRELVNHLLPVPIALGLPAHALLSSLLLCDDLETLLRTLLFPLLQRLGHLGLQLLILDQTVSAILQDPSKVSHVAGRFCHAVGQLLRPRHPFHRKRRVL